MSESCGACRFSAPSDDRLTGSVECRRRPPTGGGRRLVAEWPIVGAEGWCGEFEAKPAAKPVVAKKRPAVGEVETRGEQG